MPNGEAQFQHLDEQGVVEEVAPLSPGRDVYVVRHWLTSS